MSSKRCNEHCEDDDDSVSCGILQKKSHVPAADRNSFAVSSLTPASNAIQATSDDWKHCIEQVLQCTQSILHQVERNPSAPIRITPFSFKGPDVDEFLKKGIEVALKEQYADEDMVYEVKARLYKWKGNKWEGCGMGNLRLTQSNTNPSKKRGVLRNKTSRILFNAAIGKGMKFLKEPNPKDDTGLVRFVAKGQNGITEKYTFKVRGIDTMNELHSQLERLADNEN